MGIPPGVPVKAAKSIGPCPWYCRADCPGTQQRAHPPGACPRVPAAWLPAAACDSYGKYSLSETDVQRSANDANGGHEGQFAAPGLSGRSAFSEETFGGTCVNEKDAPKAVLGSAAPESSSSSQPNCCCVSYTRRSNLLSGHGLPRQRIPLLVRVLERPS